MGYVADKYKTTPLGATKYKAPGSALGAAPVSSFVPSTVREREIQEEFLHPPESTKSVLKGISNAGQNIIYISAGLTRMGYGLGKSLVTLPYRAPKAVGQALGGDLDRAYKTLEGEILAAKSFAFVTGETVKSVPKYIGETLSNIRHPIDSGRVVIEGISQLHDIPYEEQKELFNRAQAKLDALPEEKRIPASLVVASVQDFIAETSHPLEFAYEHPVFFALDAAGVLAPAAKATGATRYVSNIDKVKRARAYAKDQMGRLFVPMGEVRHQLRSSGIDESYADEAQEFMAESAHTRYGIMEDTLLKFNAEPKAIQVKRRLGEKIAKARGLGTKPPVRFNLTKAEQLEFFDLRDSLRRSTEIPTSKNPRIQKALDWWTEDAKVLAASAGIPPGEIIQNYFHHIFPEKTRYKDTAIGTSVRRSTRGYLKQSRDVAGYLHDPIASIATIKSSIAVDNLKDAFINKQASRYGKTIQQLRAETGMVDEARFSDRAVIKSAGFAEYTPQGRTRHFPVEVKGVSATGRETTRKLMAVTTKVETHLMPKPIVDHLDNFTGARDSFFEKWVARPLDVFHREWKPLATSLRLRYHTRNIIGNIFNASWIGGAKPASYVKALKAQLDHYLEIDSPAARLYQEALDSRVLGRGFFGADPRDLYAMSDDIDKVRNVGELKANRAFLSRVPLVKDYMRAMTNFGEAVENNARLALYQHARSSLKKTPYEARLYVNKHLFDYLTGLGEVDRVIKRFIPFWSWQRFNIPLQAEFLVTQRAKNLMQAHLGAYITEENRRKDPLYEYLPEYRKKRGAIRVGTNEEGNAVYIHTRNVLPFSDLAGFLYALGGSNVSDIASVTPAFTVPLQLFRNVDEFRDRPINRLQDVGGKEVTKFMGVVVSKKTAFTLGNIPFLTEIDKVIGGSYVLGEKPRLTQRMAQAVNPFALAYVDPLSARSYHEFAQSMKQAGHLGGVFESGVMRQIALEYFRHPEDKAYQQNFHIAVSAMMQEGYPEEEVVAAIISGERAAIKSAIRKEVQEQLDGENFDPNVSDELRERLFRTYEKKSSSTAKREVQKIIKEEVENAREIYGEVE